MLGVMYDPEIKTQVETKSQTPNQLSHQGAPELIQVLGPRLELRLLNNIPVLIYMVPSLRTIKPPKKQDNMA